MALNEEDYVFSLFNFDYGSLDGYYLLDYDDFGLDMGYEDIVDLLPKDPFQMEFNMGLPSDQFHMDFYFSLPKDPFGMDFDMEATVEAIAGWIEDFDLREYEFETDESDADNGDGDGDNGNGDNRYFSELNFVWTGYMEYEQEDCQKEVNFAWTGSMEHEQEDCQKEVVDDGSMMCMEDLKCFGCEKYEIENVKNDNDADGSVAVDMIIFVLENVYFGVRDLLSIELVCKPLRDALRKDHYFWTNIQIGYPMNLVITNDDLLRLTDKAQGKLCSLTVLNCSYITNDGLKQVLERNLELTKLSLVGCHRLNSQGLLNNIKAFNSVALPGIKRLRIGLPNGLEKESLKEFKLLLGEDEDAKPKKYNPRFYRGGERYLSLDDERAIDVETCPRCQHLAQVYDCPEESCQVTTRSSQTCRACTFCISRCIRCGCCLYNRPYEETFFFDRLCFDCLKVLCIYEDARSCTPSANYLDQVAKYHFIIFG